MYYYMYRESRDRNLLRYCAEPGALRSSRGQTLESRPEPKSGSET